MSVLRTCRQCCGMSDFKPRLESDTPHHQRRPPQRGRWHRQKNKNRSPSAKNQNQQGRDTSRPPIIVVSYWISIICRGREVSRPYHAKSFGKFDATTTDRLRRLPLYLDLSPSCARKRACTICRFQRLKNPHFRLFQCSRLWFVSIQTAMYQRIGNMPKACPYVMMRFLRYDAIFTNRCKIYFRLFR